VTLSATATATAGITSPVTATGLVSMLGSVTATATVGVNSPVTGSITANFSQVQLPTIVPVLKNNQLIGLEVPTCGNYFSAVPSVFVSDPDIFLVTQYQENQMRSTFTDTYATAAINAWPSFYSLFVLNDQVSAYFTGYGIGASPAAVSAGFSTNDINILRGNLSAYFPISSNYSYQYQLVKSAESTAAQITPSLQNGRLNISLAAAGDNYGSLPDVFVIPNAEDYTLGASKTVTSAIMSGRTVTLTSAAHGLASGSLISVEGVNYVGAATLPWFGVNGLWPIVSVTTDSITYRVAKFACLTTVTLSMTTAGAKIYPVTLTRALSSASVSCAGSGYAAGSAIPFAITSDSCGGLAASGTVSVSNAGQLAGITVTCAGSGFTSASTVVSLAPYRALSGLTVTCAGSGYWSSLPAITVDSSAYVATAPGATPAVISSGLNGNGTISLSIVCAGYGYTSAPTITIAPPNGGDGIRVVTLATRGVGYSDGTFSCTVSAPPSGGAQAVVNFIKNGSSQTFAVINPGRGYTSTPLVTVPTPDLGGQVSGFSVTCAGSGYSSAPLVTLSGGGGSGAAATAIVSNGSVTSITITTGGTGYTSAPTVSLQAPDTSVYYSKQIDLSMAAVTTLLGGNSSASAFLQVEEKSGTNTTVLAQVPVTLVARVS